MEDICFQFQKEKKSEFEEKKKMGEKRNSDSTWNN